MSEDTEASRIGASNIRSSPNDSELMAETKIPHTNKSPRRCSRCGTSTRVVVAATHRSGDTEVRHGRAVLLEKYSAVSGWTSGNDNQLLGRNMSIIAGISGDGAWRGKESGV